jgi:regulator of sigma E protease
MGLLITIGLMLLALSILIVVHEAGHFWAARMFKIKVEKFFLFFDYKFKLFSVKKGDTEYGIGWIPLGGYVKIAGMLDESMDEEQLKQEPQPWEFRTKPIWQRLIVMLGGIIMNVILGCVIFIGHRWVYGETVMPMKNVEFGIFVADSSAMWKAGFRTGDKLLSYSGTSFEYFNEYADPNLLVDRGKYFDVEHADGSKAKIELPNDFIDTWQADSTARLFEPDQPAVLRVIDTVGLAEAFVENPKLDTNKMSFQAFRAGMRTGDKVIQIDSVQIDRYSQFQRLMRNRPNQVVNMVVERQGKSIPLSIHTKSISKIGVLPNDSILKEQKDYTFGEAIPAGIGAAFEQIPRTFKGLRAVVTGNANATKSMSGPIGIAKVLGDGFQVMGWNWFWRLTGMLSMVLAVMNILPIPVLDGGHVLILCIEGIIGREIPIKAKEIIMYIGFIMVLALMAFVILNDVIKLF